MKIQPDGWGIVCDSKESRLEKLMEILMHLDIIVCTIYLILLMKSGFNSFIYRGMTEESSSSILCLEGTHHVICGHPVPFWRVIKKGPAGKTALINLLEPRELIMQRECSIKKADTNSEIGQ
uniref:Uncharacterized protein n=1 Tax=Arion vulgaris TaxID=1028688 RepID=A0A0B7A9Y8_9EUPU